MASTQGGGGGLLARSSHGQQQQQRRPPPILALVHCNRCRKPLSTTLYVVGCDCVFCEGCMYEHFSNSKTCPRCSRQLTNSDIVDLVVADPSSPEDASKALFQHLFSKRSTSSKGISNSDLGARLMTLMDGNRRCVKFVVRQLIHDCNTNEQRMAEMKRAYDSVKEELAQYKQQVHSQRLTHEQERNEQQNQITVMSTMLKEKDAQIAKYRDLYAQKGISLPPASSYNPGSGGKRGPSSHPEVQHPPATARQHHHHLHHQHQHQQHQLPVQAFPNPTVPPTMPVPRMSMGSVRSVVSTHHHYQQQQQHQQQLHPEPFTPIQVPPPRSSSGNSLTSMRSVNSFGSSETNRVRDLRNPQYSFNSSNHHHHHINNSNNGTSNGGLMKRYQQRPNAGGGGSHYSNFSGR